MTNNPNTRMSSDAGLDAENSLGELTTLLARHDQESVDDYLWRLLHGGKLAGLHFRRNQLVDGFIAPFYCRLSGLVIEVDEEEAEQATIYRERERAFARHGLQTLRIGCESLIDRPADTLQHILRAAEAPKSQHLRLSHGNR